MNINSKEDVQKAIELGFDWAIFVAKDNCIRNIGAVDSLFYCRTDTQTLLDNFNRIYPEGTFEAIKLNDAFVRVSK